VLVEFIVCLCKKSFIVIDGQLASPTLALRASFVVILFDVSKSYRTLESQSGKTFHRPTKEVMETFKNEKVLFNCKKDNCKTSYLLLSTNHCSQFTVF